MTVSAKSLRFDENSMWVELSDGRTLGAPLAWFSRLLHATRLQRLSFEISREGLHWDEIDEDISIAGLLRDVAIKPSVAPRLNKWRHIGSS